MSKFITTLPTEVETLIAALPKGSYVHGITLNPETKEVLVLWENTIFESGLTVPVEFNLSDVKGKKLPKGVYNARKGKPATLTPAPVPAAPTVTPDPSAPAPTHLTQEQVESAVKDGKAVEFMGIEPKWKLFDPKADVFTAGYFYRLKLESLDKPV